MTTKHARAVLKSATKESGRTRFTMVASTSAIDRDKEIIEVNGWRWPTPLPKLYYGHGPYSDPNKHIGKLTDIRIEDGALVVDAEISDDLPDHHMARLVGQQVRAGDLDQGSVGFIPEDWEDLEPEKSAGATRRYKKQELIEFSLVGVPSQTQSLMLGVKALMAVEAPAQPAEKPAAPRLLPPDDEKTEPEYDERWLALGIKRPRPTLKVGAVLSRANSDRLTQAKGSLDEASAAIGEVLASATRAEEDTQA